MIQSCAAITKCFIFYAIFSHKNPISIYFYFYFIFIVLIKSLFFPIGLLCGNKSCNPNFNKFIDFSFKSTLIKYLLFILSKITLCRGGICCSFSTYRFICDLFLLNFTMIRHPCNEKQ